MRIVFVFLLFFFSCFTTTQVEAKSGVSTKQLIQEIFTNFEAGNYQKVISILDKLEKRVKLGSKKSNKLQGLIYYWKGMSYSRLNDYELAEEFLEKAVMLKYDAKDLYYEYGQVLYVAEKYRRARVAFKKSVSNKYKIAVSVYYIASISLELKDYKKAASFFNMLEKLPKDQTKDVLQAARTQIADIYLIQVEKSRNPFTSIQKYVIPQYEKAYNTDVNTRLAQTIKSKIETLQRRYEIILFRMRNGKPTARPPYFTKVSMLYGSNDNVTAISEDAKTTSDEKDYASTYYTVSALTRYSFYPSSSFSYAPQLTAGYTKYNSDSTDIMRLNNYFIKTTLQTNYEHLYNDAPATFYVDFDYTYNADDADADKNFAFANTTYAVTLSEELQLLENSPSTFRFNYTSVNPEDETLKSASYGFILEQLFVFRSVTLFWYNNYNLSRYADTTYESLNTNAFTSRIDFIFPTFFGLFNPILYGSIFNNNFIEDTEKGTTSLTTFGLNMNRPIAKKLYLTADFSTSTQSAPLDEDNYKNTAMLLTLDYIY